MIHVGRMAVKALCEMTIDLSGDLVGDFQPQRARPLTQLSNYHNATEGKILTIRCVYLASSNQTAIFDCGNSFHLM